MNRIFNVIWSKTTNCWTVVSEFVRSDCGGKSTSKRKRALLTTGVMLMMMASVGSVDAAQYYSSGAIGYGVLMPSNNFVYSAASSLFSSANPAITENWNVVVGSYTATTTINGSYNSYYGNNVGNGTEGSYNTAIGGSSGNSVTGNTNNASGYEAGNNVTGDGNNAV